MKKRSKIVALLLAAVMLASLVAGCGSNNSNKDASNGPSSDTADAGGKKTVKIYVDGNRAKDVNFLNVVDGFKKDTGINVEFNVIPGDGVDIYKKIDIDMGAKDSSTDIILLGTPILLDKYIKSGSLLPLNELIQEDNYDAKGKFGKYLQEVDGNVYSLPFGAGNWAVYFNKKIFDDANVPYPSGAWTWDQYIETAKKLTDKSKGIYGSYMLDYDCYMYFTARQKNVPGHKADGTSNYDDPAFKEALQFFGDLGNVHKVQPSWMEFKTKKLAWDGFMSGKYGMHVIGTWYTNMFLDKENYPRDWNFGIVELPTPEDGAGNNNLGVISSLGINANTKQPKEAFEFVKYFAENNYKFTGDQPARVDLTDKDINDMFQTLVDRLDGEVSVDDLNKAIYQNDLGFADEKIVGPASAEYSNIILQESELYLIGQKSLDDTVKSIKERADQAIKSEQ
ncbi:extracellular solute-binding protein [Paenibacillus sp. Marseille-P2973]|uniref:ABC transporter substrate-binding protein n=1 Tax=Paenibacillus sp. Marseille-P2973 TaxID=1871032 RepID=UPI001B374527|nr:extracellular solute-binding protein [Paenibacillus sp. Marseille-P2973]MBQ4899238.1 extracellular solute-binding protein [Paenibacillus sp. Marseille-P2973]